MDTISEKTVERLSLYRRILESMAAEGKTNIFSHQLSTLAGGTAAQVRQDLRVLGYSGSSARGYDVSQLIESIGTFFQGKGCHRAVLVGIGNLGRALLAFFAGRSPYIEIQAAFDVKPEKTGRVIHGCRCYQVDELVSIVKREKVCTAIIAVPVQAAQQTADLLIEGGISGILNFAPTRIHVPAGIYVDNIDLTMSVEKVAYFANKKIKEKEKEL